MLPLVEDVMQVLGPLAQNPQQRLGEVGQWMTSVLASFWLTLVYGPRAEACWRTVTTQIRPLINPARFDVPTALPREVVDGLSAADVARRIPKEFMNEGPELDLLRVFQDFHFFLLTGESRAVLGFTEEGECVTQSDLMSRFKDETAARQAWARCTPLFQKKRARLEYGHVVGFKEVMEIDGNGGKRRRLGGDGRISPEDDPRYPLCFFRSSYGEGEKLAVGMRVCYVVKECMQGEIADFVTPADDPGWHGIPRLA